ncbi:MAG: tyrosine-type recombinase/integrase [Spirochaetales bacterium]|jgi:integrase/recombinase XerD|nr:tyrosine-type recombinase/integrase [Spirochaetales bacterium]
MDKKIYKCPERIYHSYLAPAFISFVEYKVNIGGCVPESLIPVLRLFDRYCGKQPENKICLKQESVHEFLKDKNVKISTMMHNEAILRSFGRYMALVLRIQDAYVLPHIIRRNGKTFVPYVFSNDEVGMLFQAADRFRLTCDNKITKNMVNCMRCIIKVLYCTGMRVSEACNLKVVEVDLENRIIHINHAKNDNKRIVTISATLLNEIRKYLSESAIHHSSGVYFFDSGARLNDGAVGRHCVYSYFRRYLELAGIEHKGLGFGPRLHDLRVTFAVHSLKRLAAETEDVNASIAYLSTFMGHKSLRETQSYLWLTKELYSSTLAKMENYTSFISEIYEQKVGKQP